MVLAPEWDGEIQVEIISEKQNAVGGKAIRKEVKLSLIRQGREVDIFGLIYLPKTKQPVPVSLGLNFYGNHTLTEDKSIRHHQCMDQE